METKLYTFLILLLMMMLSACGAGNPSSELARQKQSLLKEASAPSQRAGSNFAVQSQTGLTPGGSSISADESQTSIDAETFLLTLDQIAEIERSGSWIQGMALREAGIRENAGDLAGAVTAAYKELSWAYGLGFLQKDDLERGIKNVFTVKNDESITVAANAILAFEKGRWEDAETELLKLKQYAPLTESIDEPDSFNRWMMLVCSLEKNASNRSDISSRNDTSNRSDTAAYGSIRARYTPFPEYWYRGARAFSGAIAADYAENCINLAPNGPFSQECRKIIAAFTGLKADEGLSIKTKKEIETIVNQSVSAGNPQFLNSLLPLIGLPDNPYTIFAVSALRSTTNIPGFRDYFNKQAASSTGRLAERLLYIGRG